MHRHLIMPKNKKGNKRGRKSAQGGNGASKGVRRCEEEGEMYAVVTKVLGGANCTVVCQDGVTRLCVIRSKFRWRNKSHNRVSPGTWLVVGVRTWEVTAKGQQKCDVLEVYSDSEASSLRDAVSMDWGHLVRATQNARPGEEATVAASRDTEVVFSDKAEMEREAVSAAAASLRSAGAGSDAASVFTGGAEGEDDDDIDLDDI